MTDLKKGRIYKIISNIGEEQYIGSTTQQLPRRFCNHCVNYRRYKNGKLLKKTSSFDLFDKYNIENCKIVLIEEIDFNEKHQLRQREQYWIDNTECINKQRSFLTQEQDKDYKIKFFKEYYNKNKETLIQYQIKYRDENRDKIKEQRKKYRELNRDKILQTAKAYRENNKDKIREYEILRSIRRKKSSKEVI